LFSSVHICSQYEINIATRMRQQVNYAVPPHLRSVGVALRQSRACQRWYNGAASCHETTVLAVISYHYGQSSMHPKTMLR
jgi:hypothetical protein